MGGGVRLLGAFLVNVCDLERIQRVSVGMCRQACVHGAVLLAARPRHAEEAPACACDERCRARQWLWWGEVEGARAARLPRLALLASPAAGLCHVLVFPRRTRSATARSATARSATDAPPSEVRRGVPRAWRVLALRPCRALCALVPSLPSLSVHPPPPARVLPRPPPTLHGVVAALQRVLLHALHQPALLGPADFDLHDGRDTEGQ